LQKDELDFIFTGEIDNTRYGYKDVEMVHKIIDEMCKQIGIYTNTISSFRPM
jgi:tetrahydromethanopterin S-methyltransferase subunit H